MPSKNSSSNKKSKRGAQQRGRFTLSQPILIPAQSDLSLVVTAKGTGNLSPNPGGGRQTGLWFELLGIGLI